MPRVKGSKNKVKEVSKVKEVKTTSKTPLIEPPPLGDPSWAKDSCVDPKTGIHISQWRMENQRKQDGK